MRTSDTPSDQSYEEDLRNAEREYYLRRCDWFETLTKKVEELPDPQTDESALLAQAEAEVQAAVKGEPLSLDLRPPANEVLIGELAKACHTYTTSRLNAYSRFLRRHEIPYSHALNLLEQHATMVLEETHRRKWNPGIQYVEEFFDCGRRAEECWHLAVEKVTWASLREKVEPEMSFGMQTGKEVRDASSDSTTVATEWSEIEIVFTSEHRIQVCIGPSRQTYNCGDLGFEDRRTTNPNLAWMTLRELAESEGTIKHASMKIGDWPKVEKRMQEIRKVLRKLFNTAADPIPFIPGTGYQALFKISCSRSYHT